MAGVDPESWDFISPAAHKNTHVLGRGLRCFSSVWSRNISSGLFESHVSDAGHTLPSPRTKIAQAKLELIFVLVEMGGFEPPSELG